MQRVVRTLFRMRGRKANQPVSSCTPLRAGYPSLLSPFFPSVDYFLDLSLRKHHLKPPVTPIRTKQPLSPEILAIHARAKRPVATAPTASLELATTATALTSTNVNSEQGPGGGAIGPGPGCNLFPAPASVGASVPLSYFGPPPSDTNRSLVGPVQLLDTGVLDVAHGTITIPLYLGHLRGSGKNVWYILTDVDDSNVAAELGLNFSAKLTFASHSARTGNLDANGNIVFDAGTVEL